MHRAIVILRRAVRDILDNPVAALQVSVLPLLLVAFVGDHWLQRAIVAQQGFLIVPGKFVWWMWALGLFFSLVPILAMAVGWHRFVLMGERPWPVAPRLHPGRIATYGWRTVVVSVMAALSAAIGAFIVAIALAVPLAMVGASQRIAPITETVGSIAGGFFFAYAFVFFSGALVAAACGRRMKLSEAIRLGDRNTVAVFWLTLASFGIVWGLEAIKGLIDAGGVVLGGYELTSGWFVAMLNIGLLTALVAQSTEETADLPGFERSV